MKTAWLAMFVAASSLALVTRGHGQARGSKDPFTIAVNTSTIEGAPVYVAEAAAGSMFTVINGGVRNLSDASVSAATNSETQMLLATIANPRIRLLLTVADGLYRIIARKSAGIRSLADLRGKKVTTARETSAHYYLFKMLGTARLQESDVSFVDVERTAMAEAVARRDADVISMWEPEAQKALDALGGDASVFENTALYHERFSLYTTTDVLNDPDRRSGLVEFVRAVLVAAETVRSDRARVIPIVAKKIGQSEAIVNRSWAHHAFPAALPADMLDLLTEEERWVAKLQKREPRTRDRLAAFIDGSVLNEARRR